MMLNADIIPLMWRVDLPTDWPTHLHNMSYTQLKAIEGCARQWSLQHAKYPGIWDKNNYPDKPNIGLLRGRVIHGALETLVKAFVESGISDIRSEAATGVIGELGGLRNLINVFVEREIEQIRPNPRIKDLIRHFQSELDQNRLDMLDDLKRLLRRIPGDKLEIDGDSEPIEHTNTGRGPLSMGIQSEVELRPTGMDWVGYADLMYLDEDQCEIRDFKSGGRNDGYSEQLQIYAVLWYLDRERNPDERLADRLVISYPDGDVEVDVPSVSEIKSLASKLEERTASARESLGIIPPAARPSWEQCQWCSVKHLCEEYWAPATQAAITSQKPDRNDFVDAQLRLESRSGPKSFSATVISGTGLSPNSSLVLIDQRQDPYLSEGKTIRVLGGLLHVSGIESPDETTHIITLTRFSERFFVD